MKKLLLTGTALLSSSAAFAGGLDRSGQSIGLLFEEGRYVEFSMGLVMPEVGSTSVLAGNNTGTVTESYFLLGGGFRDDINDKLSYAVIFDQPWGANVLYPQPTATTGSFLLGGTGATADSFAITGLLRYKFTDRFSVHGGLRAETVAADVSLGGAVYGPLNGYNAAFSSSTGFGYAVGGAYEIPDIALRVALTYNSEISHDLDTVETTFLGVIPGVTTVVLPQSVNLDFQTGIMADTLLFGSVRWVNWNGFDVTPGGLLGISGESLVEYTDDYYTTNIGIGRRFSDTWSGAIEVGYEGAVGGVSSPLSPSDGYWSLGVGGSYTRDNTKISAGVRAVMPGSTIVAVGGTPYAEMGDGMAIAVGMSVGYSF
jgi:long-chain fatty acid transport protein